MIWLLYSNSTQEERKKRTKSSAITACFPYITLCQTNAWTQSRRKSVREKVGKKRKEKIHKDEKCFPFEKLCVLCSRY